MTFPPPGWKIPTSEHGPYPDAPAAPTPPASGIWADSSVTAVANSVTGETHVFFQTADGHIWQARRHLDDIGPVGSSVAGPYLAQPWTLEDITALASAVPAVPGAKLASVAITRDAAAPAQGPAAGVVLAVYYADRDAAVRELALHADGTWQQSAPLGTTGNGQFLAAYVVHDPDPRPHLAYLDTDRTLRCGPVGEAGDLTHEASPATPGLLSPLEGYVDTRGRHRLLYLSDQGHVCQVGYEGRWEFHDLTQELSAPPAGPIGLSVQLARYYEDDQHIATYADAAGQLTTLVWSELNGRWILRRAPNGTYKMLTPVTSRFAFAEVGSLGLPNDRWTDLPLVYRDAGGLLWGVDRPAGGTPQTWAPSEQALGSDSPPIPVNRPDGITSQTAAWMVGNSTYVVALGADLHLRLYRWMSGYGGGGPCAVII